MSSGKNPALSHSIFRGSSGRRLEWPEMRTGRRVQPARIHNAYTLLSKVRGNTNEGYLLRFLHLHSGSHRAHDTDSKYILFVFERKAFYKYVVAYAEIVECDRIAIDI